MFEEKQYFRQPWLWGLLAGVALLSGELLYALPAAAAIAALYLEVKEQADGLLVRFFPLVRRLIPYSEIRSATARTYNPIPEYGGWGIRGLGKNRAYNVSGNRGVQLVLTNGDRILIGSQRPEELEAAIRSHLPRGGSVGDR